MSKPDTTQPIEQTLKERSAEEKSFPRGSLLRSHQHRLTVTKGPDEGQQLDVEGRHILIGTAPAADFQLSDRTVSRCHCEVRVSSKGYFVRDLGSKNGTVLNGTRIVEAFLSVGSELRVGRTAIVFRPRKHWVRVASRTDRRFGELVGRSGIMQRVFDQLEKVAKSGLSCVLVGETGTGKELAARAIHASGVRAEAAFVVIDCGALNPALIESELFGHERGAFTGADRARQGAFEAASGGTVFLDEVGELPMELQPKLLRVLEKRELRRLGSTQPIKVDVRVIAATHRDLPAMVERGEFRQDLYYRLAEVGVRLPPLRDRLEDVPLIAQEILAQGQALGGTLKSLAPETTEALQAHAWPGNVRELRNVIRRAAAFSSTSVIALDEVLEPSRDITTDPPTSKVDVGAAYPFGDELPLAEARGAWTAAMEREYLTRLMRRCSGNLDEAARYAGVHRKSLERLLRQHQLRASSFPAES